MKAPNDMIVNAIKRHNRAAPMIRDMNNIYGANSGRATAAVLNPVA